MMNSNQQNRLAKSEKPSGVFAMSLTLYIHPLASFCHKVLIALYEGSIPFEPRIVNLGDAADREAFSKVWPPAKFPVIQDAARGQVITKDDPDYEAARKVYNGMIDRRPRVVVRPVNAGDVMTSVGFARENRLDLSVRGGSQAPMPGAPCATLECTWRSGATSPSSSATPDSDSSRR